MKTKPTPADTAFEHTEAQRTALDAVLALANKASPQEDDDLRLSIERRGQLVPILRMGGVVVDGRRRLAALERLGKEPWFVDIDDVEGTESKLEPATALGQNFVAANACRRELPLVVRAAMAEALATFKKGDNQHAVSGGVSRKEAARVLGVSSDTLDRYRFIKDDPDALSRAMAGDITLAQAARVVRAKSLAQKAIAATDERGDIASGLERLVLAGAKVGVILADVPTDYDCGRTTSRVSPSNHYPTMTTDALKALRVDQIAAADSVLWYWTPNSMIPQALEVIKAWGFRYTTCAVWVKAKGVLCPGAIRAHHETLLIAKRGQGLVHNGRMRSVYQSPAVSHAHSAKPAWFADQVDVLYPGVPKVELFARNPRAGWITLGNQVKVEQVAEPGATEAANDDAPSSEAAVAPARKAPKKKRAAPAAPAA